MQLVAIKLVPPVSSLHTNAADHHANSISWTMPLLNLVHGSPRSPRRRTLVPSPCRA